MQPKRILVESGLLLVDGVVSLLSRQEGLQILETPVANHAELVRTIGLIKPDTVILEETSGLNNPQEIMQILCNFANLRVVIVREGVSQVQIYQKEQIAITDTTDLSQVV